MLKLYRPLKSTLMTQGYGPEHTKPEMLPQYQAMGISAHNGIDWVAQEGEDIRFNGTGMGFVLETSLDEKAGLGVVVCFDKDNKNYKAIYWHLKSVAVKPGDDVESGTLLGSADSTGWSTGPHLHFGLKECDQNWNTINRDNGYDGAINPEPYLQNYYILDLKKQLLGQTVVLLQQVFELLKKLLWLRK